jgi:manganese transport protein
MIGHSPPGALWVHGGGGVDVAREDPVCDGLQGGPQADAVRPLAVMKESLLATASAGGGAAAGLAGVAATKPFGKRCCDEVLSLLKWSMLAACTVGPGTVVVCAKAGADYDLQLMWTLMFASVAAFVMQREAARLSIQSGMSFGQAIRLRFGTTESAATGGVPCVAYMAVAGVMIGNAAYTANCFVGAMGALHVLYRSELWFNILMSVVTGALTLVALLCANIDQLGQALGVCILGMTVIFFIVALQVDVDGGELGVGLLPGIPGGSSRTVLSMVSTTCIPFNMFLAASMSEGSDLAQTTRGVACAAVVTAIVSMLVVIIGSAIEITDPDADFGERHLGFGPF